MKGKRIIILAIIGLGIIASALAYTHLPAQVASHWNSAGIVNGTMPRLWGVGGMPLLMVTFLAIFILVQHLDPRRKNIIDMQETIENFGIVFLLFLLYVHILTLLWNLGYPIDITRWLIPGLAVLFYAVGDMIANARQNWFFGIRTPWTLSDEQVWNDTNKLGGKLFKISAVVSLLGLFFPLTIALWFLLVPIIGVTIYVVCFSYVRYTQLKRSPPTA